MTKWICPICGDKELTIECPHNTKDVFNAAATYREALNIIMPALQVMQTDCGPAAVMAADVFTRVETLLASHYSVKKIRYWDRATGDF